jgi:hypothetical protein
LGDVICKQGDFASARTLYQESLTILRELGNRGRIAYTLKELGSVVAALGSPLRAARIWAAAERLREEIGSLPPSGRPRGDPSVDAARAAVGEDAAFDRAWQEGRTLTLEQAIALTRDDGGAWN